MKDKKFTRRATFFAFLSILLAAPFNFQAEPRSLIQQPNIGVNGFFSADKAQQGRTIQAAVVINIPSGYHINSNRPLASFLIPTSVKIESGGGLKVGAVSYPRAQLRNFSFSQDQLSVFEGRVVLRFNVTVPTGFTTGVTELRARVRYQSCNDEACFPPVTRTVTMPISVVGTDEAVKKINKWIFGGSRRG